MTTPILEIMSKKFAAEERARVRRAEERDRKDNPEKYEILDLEDQLQRAKEEIARLESENYKLRDELSDLRAEKESEDYKRRMYGNN